MLGIFGLFGRSRDTQRLDRALRSAGVHPRLVPDAVKIIARSTPPRPLPALAAAWNGIRRPLDLADWPHSNRMQSPWRGSAVRTSGAKAAASSSPAARAAETRAASNSAVSMNDMGIGGENRNARGARKVQLVMDG